MCVSLCLSLCVRACMCVISEDRHQKQHKCECDKLLLAIQVYRWWNAVVLSTVEAGLEQLRKGAWLLEPVVSVMSVWENCRR